MPSGDVLDFRLTPGGTRAVFRADKLVDEEFELFSVPAAGGTALALAMTPAFTDVTAFRIDLESQWVVFSADLTTNSVLELFRAPIDASTAPERINRALSAGGDVQTDFVPLTGGRVVYRADAENDVLELFCFQDLGFEDPLRPSAEPTRSRTLLR